MTRSIHDSATLIGFFFFQAEDGIRDLTVTGVQTCALPISRKGVVRRDAGVYSGREIARRLRRNLAFRYLAGDGPVPDFRTVNRFRLRHREDFALVLRETGRLARAAGSGSLGLAAIDGTKVRANTSRHKAMSHGRRVAEAARLERECAAIVARMEEVTAAEDNLRRLHAFAVACG